MRLRTDQSHHEPSAPRSHGRNWLGTLIDYGPWWLALGLLIVLPILFVVRGEIGQWNTVYVPAARHMAAHEPVNYPHETYAYPPSMALLAVPIGNLPLPASLFAWAMVNGVATIATFVFAWRLIGGPKLHALPARWLAIFWLGTILASRWITSPLENQQFDMVIAALLMAGCWRIVQGGDSSGGLLLGVAASMKCTPLLFAPYLAWRGRWRAAALMVAAAVGMNLLPDVIFPKHDGGWYLADWRQFYLADVGASAPGTWFSHLNLNQSLGGMFNRLVRFGLPESVGALEQIELPAHVTRLIKWLTYGAGAALVSVTVAIGGRPLRAPADDASRARQLWVCEFCAIVALMLLLSPMSSKAHYAVLWLPSLLLARRFVEAPTRMDGMILLMLAICGPLTTKGLVGKSIGDWTLAWGLPTWYVLIVLAAMWRAHVQIRKLAPRHAASTLAAGRPSVIQGVIARD